jgi:hypothetical protein
LAVRPAFLYFLVFEIPRSFHIYKGRRILPVLKEVSLFKELIPYNADAVPLGLRDPFVVGVLPRPLRGDGKNGELRAVVVPRLTLLRVCTNEADDRH